MSKEQIIYLALGSNLGDRQAMLESAIGHFSAQIQIRKCSPIYETKPWGYAEQQDFLNMALEASTELSAEELLVELKAIENLVGSKASFQNGPREIDIDILFYGDEIIAMDNLVIPHPRLHERAFVLIPMLDLNSEFVHPEFDKTISEAAKSVDKQGVQQFAELEQCGRLTTNT